MSLFLDHSIPLDCVKSRTDKCVWRIKMAEEEMLQAGLGILCAPLIGKLKGVQLWEDI